MPHPLSIVLSVQPASFSALAYKGDVAENLARIKRAGYDGVELAIRDPLLLDQEEILAALTHSGLPVPAIGTGQAFGEEGLCFVHQDASVRRQAIARIKSHVPLAEKLGAVIIIGLIRGRTAGGFSRQNAEELIRAALEEIAGSLPGARFAIEPINRYETEFIQTVEAGLLFLDRLGLKNVGLLLDSFHMNIEEPSIAKSIEMAGDRIFHFHIADSNRWHPGAGHIDFCGILAALDHAGYRGYLSAEILPMPDGDTAAGNTMAHMRKLL